MPPRKPKPPKPKELQPWDILPTPDKGDEFQTAIYTAVGHALSKWEEIEEILAQIFSVFVGAPELAPGKGPAVRAYGSVNNFYGRADMVQAAAEAFFREAGPEIRHALQSAVADLMYYCRELCARRNDIAHGKCDRIGRRGHYLVPSFYNTKKHKFDKAMNYSYSSKEIEEYARSFTHIGNEAHRVMADLITMASMARKTAATTP